MVTGLEILGAIVAIKVLLTTEKEAFEGLVQNYQAYTEVGQRTVQVRDHFEQLDFILDSWVKVHGLDTNTTEELCRAFWGERGWILIRDVLAGIQTRYDDLRTIVDREFAAASTYNQLAEADLKRAQARIVKPSRWSSFKRFTHSGKAKCGNLERLPEDENKRDKRIQELRVRQAHVNEATGVTAKIDFILSTSEKLEKRLRSLEEDVHRLKEVAKAAWELQHPGMDYQTPYRRRHLAAFTRVQERVLQEARQMRTETKALYSCCSTDERALWLDIDLLEQNSKGQLCKCFHFHVPSFKQDLRLEVFTNLLREQPSPDEGEPQDEFLDACKKAYENGASLLWANMDIDQSSPGSSQESPEKVWFRLCKRSEPLRAGQSSISQLSGSLNSLLKAERLELAYQIAQSGLLLLGSSWLEAIGSSNLGRYKANETSPRYILEFKRIHHSLLSRALLQNPQREKKDIHLYTFAIGACLVEIALQTKIMEIKLSPSERVIQITESDTPKYLSARQIISRVKEEMGDEYSEAVEFCLQDPEFASNRKWDKNVLRDKHCTEEEISVALLDLFFRNVFVKYVLHGPEASRIMS